jgi:hypothetical protein
LHIFSDLIVVGELTHTNQTSLHIRLY